MSSIVNAGELYEPPSAAILLPEVVVAAAAAAVAVAGLYRNDSTAEVR